jgi:methionyl-tRNA formyltransferase
VARADAGRIVDQQAVPILPDDTAREVFDKVTVAAEQVLWRALPAIVEGRVEFRVNDLAQGSCFGARRPEDGRIDWSRPAREVYALIRAVAPPYPGAFTDVAGVRVVVSEARLRAPVPAAAASAARPLGLQSLDGRIVGVCGDGGAIEIRGLLANGAPLAAGSLAALLAAQPHERPRP